MTLTSRPLYRERSRWSIWARLLYVGLAAGACLSALVGPGFLGDTEPGVALALVGLALALHFGVEGLDVRLDRDGVTVSLGRVGLIRTRIPYEDVRSVTSVTYRPILDFGGWGLRFRPGKRAWSASGNQAVVLGLESGTEVYVGSENPLRLAERIRAAAGPRIPAA